jgi:hypothetical protein
LAALAKGKLERWHRTFRNQFMGELDERHILHLDDLNARLWAWVEQIYHCTEHAGLGGFTPLTRYQQDLSKIRRLGPRAAQLDALFHHRISRFVRKDGTVSYLGKRFEVAYELAGKTIQLVVNPHAGAVVGVENDAGESLGPATKLDAVANLNRVRRKPDPEINQERVRTGPNLVELAYEQYHGKKGD